jgi:hypothetical protein
MNWFVCVLSQKPFLEWEIEKFVDNHPRPLSSIVKKYFYFSYNCESDMLFKKDPSEDNPSLQIVMGRGYLSKSTGYGMADGSDWEKLIKHEYQATDIDGHYIAIKLQERTTQFSNDLYGHYPIYYTKIDDYIIISNLQHFLIALLQNSTLNLPSFASHAILPAPLVRSGLYNEISILEPGSILTTKNHQIDIKSKKIHFLIDETIDFSLFSFKLKKAIELQLRKDDFMFIAYEKSIASRFAYSVWLNKPKKDWGIYYKKDDTINPDRNIDPLILNDLTVSIIPDFVEPIKPGNSEPFSDRLSNEIFRLYKSYVQTTGLHDFPNYFYLAGRFKKEESIQEINLFLNHIEWFFIKNPIESVVRMAHIFKSNSLNDFKKFCILENSFYKKDFYKLMVEVIAEHFKSAREKIFETRTEYDQYQVYLYNYHATHQATGLAWLNSFRHIYSPGMLYSLNCYHLKQRMTEPKYMQKLTEFSLSIAPEVKNYLKPIPNKDIYPHFSNQNRLYFPTIVNHIAKMIETTSSETYYDMERVRKIFEKAKSRNGEAINAILRWVAIRFLNND